MATPRNTVDTTPLTIPAHLYAHTEVKINDNTIREYTRAPNDNCRILAVFASPKGEDRVMKTIEGGIEEFDATFGVGPYFMYGQPLLNARAAANTGNVTLQCLRITAQNATYANTVVWVQYKGTAGIPAISVGDTIPAVYWTEGATENVVHTGDANDIKTAPVYYTEGETTEIVHSASDVKTPAVYWGDGETETRIHQSTEIKTPATYYTEGEIEVVTHNSSEVKTAAVLYEQDVLATQEDVDNGLATTVGEVLHHAGDEETPAVYWNDGETENVTHHAGDLKSAAVYWGDGETETVTHNSSELKTEAVYWEENEVEEIVHHSNEIKTPAVYWEEGEVEVVVHSATDVKVPARLATAADERAAVPGKLQVRFVSSPLTNVRNIADFYDTFDLLKDRPTATSNNEILTNVPDCEDGWAQIPFIGVISKGRGTYGDAYSFRISNHPRADKTTSYKNYFFRVFEGTQTVDESKRVTLYEDAIVNNSSIFMEEIVNGLNNGVTGSKNIRMKVNTDVQDILFDIYSSSGLYPNTHLTRTSFDPILGIDKTLAFAKSASYDEFDDVVQSGSGMPGFEIVSDFGSVQFNTMTGIKLGNGSDGSFAWSTDPTAQAERSKSMRIAYYYAFTADVEHGYDRDIMSKTKFPLDAVFDADFPIGVPLEAGENRIIGSEDEIAKRSLKGALADLVDVRHEDCFCFMDLGTDRYSMLDQYPGTETGFVEKAAAYEYAEELEDSTFWWNYSIDAYYGKIRDPYNKKIITVTSTYNLIVNYPRHWKYYGGKHIPYAGSKYGVIDQYIKNTIFPVFDVDLDSDYLDKLTDKHVNYAQINSKLQIIRGSQLTRWPDLNTALKVSNLSETNNALIVLDIKKDAIKLVENYAYNFNESSDIAMFNRDAEELVTKYRDAQVRSITATFSRTEEEAELGILHLTITVVHKALVKINLIDIDVNRAVNSES